MVNKRVMHTIAGRNRVTDRERFWGNELMTYGSGEVCIESRWTTVRVKAIL